MNFELWSTLFLLTLIVGVAFAYMIRVLVIGKAHFDRVDQQGSGVFLSKGLMELGYWFFQPLARLLVFFHVTANQISWGSLLLGGISGSCLAFGHFGSGAVFAFLSSMFDSLDGLVARITGQSSDAGEVLDASVDRYVEFFFLAGLVFYYRTLPILLLLALFAILGSFMVSYSTAKAEALQITPPRGGMRRPERAVYLVLGAALSPCTIPWLEATRDHGIAIGHPMVLALFLVTVLSNLSAIERLYTIAKIVRAQEENQFARKSSLKSHSVHDQNDPITAGPVT